MTSAFRIAKSFLAHLLLASFLIAGANGTSAQSKSDFGVRLVTAARKQTWIPVIYNPAYRKIDYPMGDVPWYFGVCTDVVVRAYRSLGIDLQVLVQKAGAGTGDANIDHRRVPVLRTFFARMGRSLGIGKDAALYAPGDIVTYYVPDGRFSKTHVAIVSDRKSSSGVPLVLHNRGWGVAEEDWLFAAQITGHFRFAPPSQSDAGS